MNNIYKLIYESMINNEFKYSNKELMNSFKSAYKIYQSIDNNIVKESNYIFTLSDQFISMILNCQNGTMLTKNILLKEFTPNSIEYKKILSVKQDYPIFIYTLNFTIKDIAKVVDDFCIDTNDIFTSEIIARAFLNENKNLAGAVISLPMNVKLLLFNKKKLTKQVIIHEFYHYFQDVTKFGFTNKINSQIDTILNDRRKVKLINTYGFTEEFFSYIFSRIEFLPHVNDLCHILKEVYNKYYQKKLTPINFLNMFINDFVMGNNIKSANKLIDQYSYLANDECSPLYMVKIAYLLNFKYDIILNKLKQIFN